MKFCTDHWQKLRAAIEARGLTRFVAKDGKHAAAQFVAGKPDPLMDAHNRIVAHALDCRGIALMMPNEDGSDRCPLCFIKQTCACGALDCGERIEQWIEFAANDAAEAAAKGSA